MCVCLERVGEERQTHREGGEDGHTEGHKINFNYVRNKYYENWNNIKVLTNSSNFNSVIF